ncbi:nucleotidyltransferase family protein [Micromonospora okii]|uniref:nucleotidyltransferase family protein n=1 Tax=Micromonospora okii TaxID=1182970 RepID=UPI001E378AAF|nr:nucleotidyltransferase family protein [Micromonospora okii]
MTGAPLPAALYCLALDEAAAATHAALRARGVDSILLKGAGLARRLGVERTYGDVDLLVDPARFATAEEALGDLGYRVEIPGARPDDWTHWHERLWRSPGPVGLAVDLHRGFHGVGDAAAFWAALAAGAEPMSLAGRTVEVPSAPAAALLVALHAAHPGGSPRPRDDLRRATRVLDEETWRAAAALAEATGATRTFAFGLRRTPDGAALARRLGLPRATSALHHVVHGPATPGAYQLARAAELPTARHRLAYLARRLAPSPAAMRHRRPVARRGPAGLALAYLLRFAQVGWQAPRAVAALRRATRQARRYADG